MNDRTCSIEGCPDRVIARGWCRNHYYTWKRNGDPLISKRIYKHTDESASAIMRAAGLEPKAPYPGKNGLPWPCICLTCGAEVSPRLGGIVSGQGGCRSCADRRNGERQRGEENPAWRGDDAEYSAIHYRIRSQRGPARDHSCVDCGGQASSWSYDGGSPLERISDQAGSKGQLFSPDLMAYSPRCEPCHSNLDGRGKYPRGKAT